MDQTVENRVQTRREEVMKPADCDGSEQKDISKEISHGYMQGQGAGGSCPSVGSDLEVSSIAALVDQGQIQDLQMQLSQIEEKDENISVWQKPHT
mgnify:CR=1 FL=1